MQETLHGIHTHYDSQSNVKKQVHTDCYRNSICPLNTSTDCLLEKDLWQLTVGQRQCPKTQVWCCVWNRTQYEFNRFDNLMHCNFTDVLMVIAAVRFLHLALTLFTVLMGVNVIWLLLHFLAVLILIVRISQRSHQVIFFDFFMMMFVLMWLFTKTLYPNN